MTCDGRYGTVRRCGNRTYRSDDEDGASPTGNRRIMNTQRRRLRLLHTSDLHLGSDSYANDALRGFDCVWETAKALDVDGVLIAGDLFDSFRTPLDTVAYVSQRLGELKCPVFILPGNHDTLLTGAYGMSDSLPPLSSNVYLLQDPAGEIVTSPDLRLTIWGRPVYDHDPSFQPLHGLQARPPDSWYVVMAHGLVMDGYTGSSRSSPISVEELSEADCDYIALGHVHVFRDVTQEGPPAFYCGAPSGAQIKTAVLVTLDPTDGVNVESISLA